MTEPERYGSPAAVEAAILAAARRATEADPSLTTQERIRLEYFNRFLSRVFSEPDDSGWVLKGGTGILARVATARATTDVDLFRRNGSLHAALEDLRRLAAIDLGDFFRFDFLGYTAAVGGGQQAHTEGYQVSFDVYIGAKKKNGLHVDLVVNVLTTDDVEIASPANALELPKLLSNPYRLYPVVDQIADKVCATLVFYSGQPSSREKDLVDLVLLATTQNVNADKLGMAIEVEARARALTRPNAFTVLSTWGPTYVKLATKVPACESYRTVGAAQSLMTSFVDPVLTGDAAGNTWSHDALTWTDTYLAAAETTHRGVRGDP